MAMQYFYTVYMRFSHEYVITSYFNGDLGNILLKLGMEE